MLLGLALAVDHLRYALAYSAVNVYLCKLAYLHKRLHLQLERRLFR